MNRLVSSSRNYFVKTLFRICLNKPLHIHSPCLKIICTNFIHPVMSAQKQGLTLLLTLLLFGNVFAKVPAKLQQDRASILAMTGCYRVNFNFAETFASDTAYQYHDRYSSWGIEYVFVIEDSEKKIVLQHLLIVNDTTIIKHWRQDWVYENTELVSYYKDNEWRKTILSLAQVKGQWTQKVYQVDDSPRYEGTGTWVHVDGRHYWQSTCDAPLPRREFTKRSDYNVMRRTSHIEVTEKDGWYLEQDNQKIVRANGMDKVLCNEKGMEAFAPGSYNCQAAIDWWEQNKNYWGLVRAVWSDVFAENSALKISKKVEDKILWQKLFALEEEMKTNTTGETEKKQLIKKAIVAYLQNS
jgi:hypothetical protein